MPPKRAARKKAGPKKVAPAIAKKKPSRSAKPTATQKDKLTATLRVVCTSPPPAKLDGVAVTLGLREKKGKTIVSPSATAGGSCSWQFPVVFCYDASRATDAKNAFPGRLRGEYVENGKGEWNEDFYMYLRIMKNKGKDYVCGMKITMGCITWEQVRQAQAQGAVIETEVVGPHKHKGTTTGREQPWGGWSVVTQ
jgi:hypothetical protein